MGCDWYADENGELEIEIRDHENAEIIKHFIISGLKPRNMISYDILKGDVR